MVKQYKHLRTVLDGKLNFEAKTNIIRRKALQGIHFMRKLCSINMDVSFMKMFYAINVLLNLSYIFLIFVGTGTSMKEIRLS